MKVIGLIGGMSWESTLLYYRQINEAVGELGGLHSARIVLYSVDFHEVERLQHAGDWAAAGAMLAASPVAGGGRREFLVLCTNTMHKVAASIEEAVAIPLLHIADPTAERDQAGRPRQGRAARHPLHHGAGLLSRPPGGTPRHPGAGADAGRPRHRPSRHLRGLCLGAVRRSRAGNIEIMTDLEAQGAQAVILGCTEISLLVSQDDSDLPLFDTTAIHAAAAAEAALAT